MSERASEKFFPTFMCAKKALRVSVSAKSASFGSLSGLVDTAYAR